MTRSPVALKVETHLSDYSKATLLAGILGARGVKISKRRAHLAVTWLQKTVAIFTMFARIFGRLKHGGHTLILCTLPYID